LKIAAEAAAPDNPFIKILNESPSIPATPVPISY
jgi:hypothetical protein